MKLYTFINSYVCGIQVGIQAGHSIVELMHEKGDHPNVSEWASDYKTFVWLDGGDSSSMSYYLDMLELTDLPMSIFKEPGADYLLTAISVVVPDDLVYHISMARTDKSYLNTEPEVLALPASHRVLLNVLVNARSKRL